MAQNISRDQFLEKIFDYTKDEEWNYKGELPLIIDFYADWCGPCKMVAPVLDQLSEEYKGKIEIYKVDTEKEQELAAVFKIQSIPSILFIPKDGAPQMSMGALPKGQIEKMIKDILKVEK
jgi:thioredoxin